jgi:signal transduction histidine kinase
MPSEARADGQTRSGSLAESRRTSGRTLLWSLPFAAAFLPIVLLSVYSYQVAARSVHQLIEAEHNTAVGNLAELMTKDMNESVSLAHAIASVPLTIQAVQERNAYTISARLKALVVAYPSIDHAFITDADGVLWSEFPTASGSYGMRLDNADWFNAVRSRAKPYVGGVTLRKDVYSQKPVVTIAVPIRSSTGAFLGGMVFEYHADQITKWLQNAKIAHGGHLYVVDHTGMLVAHPTATSGRSLYGEYGAVPLIRQALSGATLNAEYEDPLAQDRMVASFLPVAIGRNTWVIVAQQPANLAYAELHTVRRNITLAGGALSLVTLVLIVALARTSRKVNRLNTDLESKNATLRDITSFVSHQLRAPVTAMRWTLESLLDGDCGPMNDEVQSQVKGLYNVVIQNGTLINDILNVSRLDRGVIEVKVQPAILGDIADRAVRDYQVPAEKSGLALKIEKGSQPISVLADGDKLAEAVSNAVSNAIKHTKAGGITLILRSDDRFGYIDVADTGEGMPPEILSHLFDRTGIKGSNTDSSQSTGLGLFIARQFTRLMGGDVTVAATVGKGSTFTYSVPLAKKE